MGKVHVGLQLEDRDAAPKDGLARGRGEGGG